MRLTESILTKLNESDDFKSKIEEIFDDVKTENIYSGYEINNSGICVSDYLYDEDGNRQEGVMFYSHPDKRVVFPEIDKSSSFDIQAPRFLRDSSGKEYGDSIQFVGVTDINKIKELFNELNDAKREYDPNNKDEHGYAKIIESSLTEEDTLSAKDYIESEYGLKLNTCAVRSKEQGIPSGLREFLDVAKEIGLNVDDVSYGFSSLEDNYVGDSKTNIQVLSSAIDGKPIIGKIICPFDKYDENKVKAVAKEIIGTEDLGNDRYNIFLDNGDWSLQGVRGEEAGVYYYGTDKKGALNKLQSLNESSLNEESRYSSIEDDDPILDKTIKVYDINAWLDKNINDGSTMFISGTEEYQSFDYGQGAAIIIKKDGSGCIVDYEGVGSTFNDTSAKVQIDLCPKEKEKDGKVAIHVMPSGSIKVKVDDLLKAPSKTVKVKDFFTKYNYNDRCASNFDNIKPYLTECDKLKESEESGNSKLKSFNDAWQEAHYLKDKVYNSYWNTVKTKEKLEKAGLNVDELKDSTEKIANNLDDLGKILQSEDLKESAKEDEEPENITHILDRWDWRIDVTTKDQLGSDYQYHTLLKNIHDAEKFNYHSDYWGSADEYQSDAIEVLGDFEPYVDKMVKIDFDDTSEVFKLLGVLVDKQYNSLGHMKLLVEEK